MKVYICIFLLLSVGARAFAQSGAIHEDGSGHFSTVIVEDSLDPGTAPVPGQLYKNSLPLAYGYVTENGSLQTSYGIDMVDHVGTGEYEVHLSVNPIGYPIAMVTAIAPSPATIPTDLVATVSTAPEVDVLRVNLVKNLQAFDGGFMILVLGNSN